MNKLLINIGICIFWLFTVCCSSHHDEEENGTMMPYKNNALPITKDTLRILALGNSYTDDGTSYLSLFMANSGFDMKKICVYEGIRSSASLQTWNNLYDKNEEIKLSLKAGRLRMPVSEAPLRSILSQNWDIIVLQQQSDLSLDYSSYNPYLNNLIQDIKAVCPNPKLSFVWQMPWIHYHGNDNVTATSWHKISLATQEQVLRNGIAIVIQTGTAIQNARNCKKLPQTGGITRNGIHLSFGLGRYIAAATWFQVLFSHWDTDWYLSTCLYSLSDNEKKLIGDNSFYDCYDVTEEYQDLCKKCARAAVQDMYNVSEVD
ncbi:MAG: DUF4886 domain-containing protein [Paraprevotella sp.]|nr:DUF4886 domain-containing protein [Paraprevotella sp.]